MQTDRREELIVTFRNFVNAPKKRATSRSSTQLYEVVSLRHTSRHFYPAHILKNKSVTVINEVRLKNKWIIGTIYSRNSFRCVYQLRNR